MGQSWPSPTRGVLGVPSERTSEILDNRVRVLEHGRDGEPLKRLREEATYQRSELFQAFQTLRTFQTCQRETMHRE